MLATIWFYYKWAWLISFVLLFFRDDLHILMFEVKMSFENKRRGTFHLVAIALLLPITLPFTLANIVNRWF